MLQFSCCVKVEVTVKSVNFYIEFQYIVYRVIDTVALNDIWML